MFATGWIPSKKFSLTQAAIALATIPKLEVSKLIARENWTIVEQIRQRLVHQKVTPLWIKAHAGIMGKGLANESAKGN